MENETRVKLLRVVLIVTGAVLCLCGVLLLLPQSWLDAVAGLFIPAETLESIWPEGALFGYAVRTSLAAYLWIGIILLVTASDPSRYGRLVDVAVCMFFVLAAVCLVAGITSGIPPLFYLGDAVPSFIVAGLLLVLRAWKAEVREGGTQ